MRNHQQSNSLFWLFLLLLSAFSQARAGSICTTSLAQPNIDPANCPQPDQLTFHPLNPDPRVVYGDWTGSANGIEFKSYKNPDGVSYGSGRRGQIDELTKASFFCVSGIVRCDYKATNSHGTTVSQALLSRRPVKESEILQPTAKLEL